ncbi:NnrS family protein (plasmid) [Rhodobacter capsulatus]|uniref:NnrS family protein n=1 Tax=Rhodobacter capsulatus TaxID=1061 RepID=UPI004029FC41
MLLDLLGWPMGDAVAGLHGALATLIALIVIIGGRITPAFTRNALARRAMLAGAAPDLGKPGPRACRSASHRPTGWPSVPRSPPRWRSPFGLPDPVIGTAELTLGAAQLIRIARWQGWAVRGSRSWPSCMRRWRWWASARSCRGWPPSASDLRSARCIFFRHRRHRHDGQRGDEPRHARPYRPPAGRPFPVALAYALIPLAALLRWAAAVGPLALYTPGTILAATLWALAFMLILIALAPLLLGPRPHS